MTTTTRERWLSSPHHSNIITTTGAGASKPQRRPLVCSPLDVANEVCFRFSTPFDLTFGRYCGAFRRTGNLPTIRAAWALICSRSLRLGFIEIASYFGMAHSSVLAMRDRGLDLYATDRDFRRFVNMAVGSLQASRQGISTFWLDLRDPQQGCAT